MGGDPFSASISYLCFHQSSHACHQNNSKARRFLGLFFELVYRPVIKHLKTKYHAFQNSSCTCATVESKEIMTLPVWCATFCDWNSVSLSICSNCVSLLTSLMCSYASQSQMWQTLTGTALCCTGLIRNRRAQWRTWSQCASGAGKQVVFCSMERAREETTSPWSSREEDWHCISTWVWGRERQRERKNEWRVFHSA